MAVLLAWVWFGGISMATNPGWVLCNNVEYAIVYIWEDPNNWCYDSLDYAIEAANAGDTITLKKDIESNHQITINKAITLDWANHILTVTHEDITAENWGWLLISANDVTVENLKVFGPNGTKVWVSNQHALKVYGASNVVLNNISVDKWSEAMQFNNSSVKLKWNITVGENCLYAGFEAKNSTVDVTEATIEKEVWIWDNDWKTSTVNGGVQWAQQFKDDTKAEIQWRQNAVATVNNVSYTTLEAAIEAAEDWDTIKLVKDIEIEVIDQKSRYTLNKKLTIDWNNKSITVDYSDTKARLFTLTKWSAWTTIKDLTLNYKSKVKDDSAAIYFDAKFDWNESNITTIQNVKFNWASDIDSIGQESAIITANWLWYIDIKENEISNMKYWIYLNWASNINIQDNKIDWTLYNAINIDWTKEAKPCNNITIEGNTLTNISHANYNSNDYSAWISVWFYTDNISIAENNDITMLNNKLPIYYAKWVAMIEDKWYVTLNEAISAHEEGDTIKLIKDVEISADLQIDVAWTLDLNGNDLTLSAGKVLTLAADVTIEDTADTKGQLVVEGNIKVNGATLDISSLNFGTDGLVAWKPGSLIADENSTIKLMPSILTVYPVTAEYLLNSGNPNFIIGRVGTIVEINNERFECTAIRATEDTCDVREIPSYTVTFDPNGATLAEEQKTATVKYNETVTAPSVSLSCNSLDGWYNGDTRFDFATPITSDLTLKAKWTYTCSRSSGGGGSPKKEELKVLSWEVKTATWDLVIAPNPNTEDEDLDIVANPEGNSEKSELELAYEFAYKNWITTMDSMEKADLNSPLTRIAMAKMLSQYAINILGKTPDTTRSATFTDISPELDAQYNNWVTLAYQLGFMGINLEGKSFRANDEVTRAEFATALSRLLFWLGDWKWAYYETHLAKLKDEGILSNDNPKLEEKRWYVMLMLMRSAK